MTDIASGVLNLRPVEVCTVPLWTGAALQAIFLNLIRDTAPAVSARLHSGSGPRPYTVSSLLGIWLSDAARPRKVEARPTLTPDQTFKVRITTLDTELTHLWFDMIVPDIAGQTIHIGTAAFTIENSESDSSREVRTSDAAMIQEYTLLANRLERHIQFSFDSPTAFRSKELLVPVPLPALVFGSLLDRWNTFNDIKLHPDSRRFAEECIAINRYRLETVYIDPEGQERRPVTGFVGTCRHIILREDRYWLGVMHTLAAYANYAGVGMDTTIGMGRLHKIERHERAESTEHS